MKTKFIALSILIMLLVSPMGGFVYAQEDPIDPPTDPTDPPVEPEDPPTDPETPLEEEADGDGNLDPLIYEQIKQQAQERFQEMYELMFGGVPPEPEEPPVDPETPPTDPETPPADPEDPPVDPEDPPTDPEGEDLPEYDGPVIPDDVDPALANQFMSAWRAMQSAEEKENPRASANQYLRAMKQLRNAYKKYQKDNPEIVEDLDAPEEGVPEGDIPDEPTESELNEVQQELVGRFQERFQERITEMLQNYNDVEDTLSPQDAVKAFSALTKAEAKLLRIQERINAGDVEGAVDDLDDASDEMDEDFESMDDVASMQMFKTMNKLEARISKMVEQAARKAAKGEDTSDLDAAIADARGNKDKTKNNFKANKGNSGGSGKPDKSDNPNKGGKKDK